MDRKATREELEQGAKRSKKAGLKRKSSEEVCGERGAHYRALFETAKDAVFVSDETGRFVDVNEAACESLGYSKDELLKLSLKDIDADPRGYEAFLKLRDGREKRVTFEVYQRKKDGSLLPVEITGNFFQSRGKRMALAIARDLTKRKRSERALRESEERYHTIFELAADSIVLIDGETGKLLEFNKMAHENLGFTREEFEKLKIADFEILEDAEEVAEHIKKIIQEGSDSFETKHRTKTGEIRDIQVSSRGISICGKSFVQSIWRDVTEHKRAEQALQGSEERYRFLFDNITLGVALIDSEHNVIMTNAAQGKMLNKLESELVGKKCFLEFEKREAICPHCPGVQAMATGQPAEAETEGIRDNGSRVGVRIRAFPTLGEGGRVTGFIEIVEDVTEKRKLRAELQQAQKLEAVGTLAGGIAHDFNNLLMGIQGNVSLMKLDINPTHPYYERLKNIEKQIQSGARLTSLLLGYARKGKYEVKPIDLNDLIKENAEAFGRTRKEITIRQELDDDLFMIEADRGQIQQVLFNLFINASDAMPMGGELILKTMNTSHDSITKKLYDPKPGNYVLLTVTDTGVGMDKETMKHIFEPFFTSKEMGHGTGLGLASAYGIIKSHGGYIEAESKKGQGTTFSVYLPASERTVRKTVEPVEQITIETGTVLLVDDEPEILDVTKELLEAMGYDILTAANGIEAVEVYGKKHEDIDIVIMDLVMPKMGGGEAYDRIKEINPDVKVLLSSGFSIDGEAKAILQRGCNGFIQKPFRIDELSERIKEILHKR